VDVISQFVVNGRFADHRNMRSAGGFSTFFSNPGILVRRLLLMLSDEEVPLMDVGF